MKRRMSFKTSLFDRLYRRRHRTVCRLAYRAWKYLDPPRRPVFVLGTHRSGTTLLTRCVAATSALHNWTEANELWDPAGYPFEADRAPRSFWPLDPWVGSHIGLFEAGDDYVAAIPGIFASRLTLHASKGARLLHKCPGNTARIEILDKLFPDAFYIHLFRDPRAVICSSLRKHEPKLAGHPRCGIDKNTPGGPTYTVNGLRFEFGEYCLRLAETWRYLVALQLEHMSKTPSERLVKLTYPEFTRDPRRALRTIDAAFGLDPARRVWDEIPEQFGSMDYKFREELPDEIQSKIHERCRPYVERLGFDF